MPGVGSSECENFVPGQYASHLPHQAPTHVKRWIMELRLQIPNKVDHTEWFLELVLPPYRQCHALMMLDVGGGRRQTLDMRGMDKVRRVMAELSTESYRIIEFKGEPDPNFISGLDWECPGLPTSGAAVFTTSGAIGRNGFPRTQLLRSFETFALLWREPKEPDFPQELGVERLRGRQGWSMALVTIPAELTQESITWLSMFTGLPFAPSTSSMQLVWPFITRKSSFNEIECIQSKVVLLAMNKMALEHRSFYREIIVQSRSERHSALSFNESPAFFSLKSEDTNFVSVEDANDPKLKEYISFSLPIRQSQYPVVELAFRTADGIRNVVSLHQRRCLEMVSKARKQKIELDYLSMPFGVKGNLYIDGVDGISEMEIFSGDTISPHDQRMRLPSSEILSKISFAWAKPENHITFDFGGFGHLYLPGIEGTTNVPVRRELTPALKSRLLSFLFQLRLATPITVNFDDEALINALIRANPETPLIPHYRLLMKEIMVNEFEGRNLEGRGSR